jgi:hypothetical protein
VSAELPPTVEFDIVLRDPLEYMERLYDMRQQTGLDFPTELVDKFNLPNVMRLRCSLDTETGETTILETELTW